MGNDDVMKSIFEIKSIAHIRTDFPGRFGIPHQSGMVESLKGTIVFEPEYRIRESLRGLGNYSHLWLIFGDFRKLFVKVGRQQFVPLVWAEIFVVDIMPLKAK